MPPSTAPSPHAAVSRRRFVRAAGAGAALAATTGLAACTAPPPSGDPDTRAAATRPAGTSRVLLAYFSRAGENYWNGGRRTLQTGNTQVLAGLIADRITCDVHRIEAADPYSDLYDPTVERNGREQNTDARPELANPVPDLTRYDVVLLGSPIWNVQPPMIMATFTEAANWSNTILRPFVTYAVSRLGTTMSFYRDLNAEVQLGDGLAVRGEQVTDGAGYIDSWLAAAGLT